MCAPSATRWSTLAWSSCSQAVEDEQESLTQASYEVFTVEAATKEEVAAAWPLLQRRVLASPQQGRRRALVVVQPAGVGRHAGGAAAGDVARCVAQVRAWATRLGGRRGANQRAGDDDSL